MLSIWEKQSFINYDYIIIGSGIVGLSTAISIKEKSQDASVLVLERGLLPTGASTKNAGFACFGSVSELLEDIKTIGKEATVELVKKRYEGLQKLRKRLGDDELEYRNHGGYELVKEQDREYLDKIEMINDLLLPVFEKKAFFEDASMVKKLGFNSSIVKSLICSPFEGQLNTGKMMAGLIKKSYEKDIRILTGAEVVGIEEEGQGVTVSARDALQKTIQFRSPKVAVCTNAFTQTLIKDINLSPGRGIVLVTQPVKNLKFKGVFHMDKGYYYFRNLGNRVLFGGGRNLDEKNETTTEFKINEKIISTLKEVLKTTILPDTPHEIDFSWAGIMAFGNNKQPILKKHSDHIFLGVRLGGMGVAIGTLLGDELSEMMV